MAATGYKTDPRAVTSVEGRTGAVDVTAADVGVLLPYSVGGTLTVQAGTGRLYNDSGVTWTLRYVRASVGTAPVGASIIIDVNVTGVSIYGSPGDRPSIAAGANTSGKVAISGVTVADGAYLTVDVDQIGSGTAGANLTVQLWAA